MSLVYLLLASLHTLSFIISCRVMIDQYQSLLSQTHAEKDLLQLESKRKWESVEVTLREHELLKSKCSKMQIQVTIRAYLSIASAHEINMLFVALAYCA